MRDNRPSIGLRATRLAFLAAALLVTGTAVCQTETVLYSFMNNGTDGWFPAAGLIFDTTGNLYGTTYEGGLHGYGTVFELSPVVGGGWTETQLYNSFDNNGTDAASPDAGVIFDGANLYGTTYFGGTAAVGAVFELSPATGGGWTESVIHSFGSGKDGNSPRAGLLLDASGNLYGTTIGGGTDGFGAVFELSPKTGGGWTEKVVYSFNGKSGSSPYGGLIFDKTGNLYGTTASGGTYGYGTVFELTPKNGKWTEKILHSFDFSTQDGAGPQAGLVFDRRGDLYGTAASAGLYGYGVAFQLIPKDGKWAEKILHNFNLDGTDGISPIASLVLDTAGNVYGTTEQGGHNNNGIVFELTKTAGVWTETVLYTFSLAGLDGIYPEAGLIFDTHGNLYSTTYNGGANGFGTVFEITP
jgi:uncharacterized repeat protein (TIGR03803 family)